MEKYLVVSTAVTDLITLPDGTALPPMLGGAGIYALAGAGLWAGDVRIICGVGRDFPATHGRWFAAGGLSTDGLTAVTAHTPRNEIRYFADGEREEIPTFGAEHYALIVPTVAAVAAHCAGATGVYVFRDAELPFWNDLFRLRERHGFQIMWEIAADSATPAHLAQVNDILAGVDVFSINRSEAFRLFGVDTVAAALERLMVLGRPLIYFRLGAEGACLITGNETCHSPAVTTAPVMDPTGAGNSSSGAVLVAHCRGVDPRLAGIMGSISAAYTIAQYGPPVIDSAARRDARSLAQQMYQTQLETEQ